MPQPGAGGRGSADRRDIVTRAIEERDETPADDSAGASNQDVHGVFLPDAASSACFAAAGRVISNLPLFRQTEAFNLLATSGTGVRSGSLFSGERKLESARYSRVGRFKPACFPRMEAHRFDRE